MQRTNKQTGKTNEQNKSNQKKNQIKLCNKPLIKTNFYSVCWLYFQFPYMLHINNWNIPQY